jgi:hypothetical protein
MTDAPATPAHAASPLIPLTEMQRSSVRRLGQICKWLGRATTVLGVASLGIVAFLLIMFLPRVGLNADVLLSLAFPAVAGVVLLWQGTVAGDAGKAFAELDESAFPGMVALALGKTSRYFAVDAVFVFGTIGLLGVVCSIAMVAS